jgi:hypothetical protein
VAALREYALDLRIDAAGYHEDVRHAVVVEILEAGAPADVACLDFQARGRPEGFPRG